MKTAGKCLIVGLIALVAAGSAQAAEEGWSYKVTPYLWAMGVNGDIGVGPVTAEMDVDFSDAVKDLEFGGRIRSAYSSAAFSAARLAWFWSRT